MLAAVIACVTASCANTVEVAPAPSATDPGCAALIARLPTTIGDRQRHETTGQSTAAYSRPDESFLVTIRCGVEPPVPTTDPCTSVADVDWVVAERDTHRVRQVVYTTYGRSPAVAIGLRSDEQDGVDAVLMAVSGLVGQYPVSRRCG